MSFESTNAEHIGVSAVVDESADQLYLMSNNSVIHNPQITVYDNLTGTPTLSHEFFLELDTTYGNYNAAGFQLRKSIWNSNALVAMGYYRTKKDAAGNTTSALPWIAEFDISTGNQIFGKVWPAPSAEFHSHGGGLLSTFQGESPYIFNQEIFTERVDGAGYIFISPITVLTNYSIDLVSFSQTALGCLEDNDFDSPSRISRSISTNQYHFNFTNTAPDYTPTNFTVFDDSFCPHHNEPHLIRVMDESLEHNNSDFSFSHTGEVNTDLLEIYPNPFTTGITIFSPGETLNGQLTIMNASGKVVYKTQLNQSNTDIDLQTLPNGIYFLNYVSENQQMVKKLIKR